MGSGDSTQPQEGAFVEENLSAEEMINAGNHGEAADVLITIVEKDPGNWRAFNSMGVIAWSQKKWGDAYVMFRKSIELCPDYSDGLVNFFDASIKLRRVAESLPYFEKALQKNPSLEEISIIRDSIVNLGDDIYLSHRALAVGTYSAIVDEAERELEAGNLNAAMEKFLKANDEEGPSAAAYCGLGVVSYYQKRYLDAFTLFVESIKLNPANADTFLNMLDAAKGCDKLAEARQVFEVCRKEYPTLEAIEKEFSVTE